MTEYDYRSLNRSIEVSRQYEMVRLQKENARLKKQIANAKKKKKSRRKVAI